MPRKLSTWANRTGGQLDRNTQVGAVHGGGQGDAAYVAVREAEAEERNERLAAQVKQLEGLLAAALTRHADVPMGEGRPEPTLADLPPELWGAAPERSAFEGEPHGLIGDLLTGLAPGGAEKRARAEAAFEAAEAAWRDLGPRRDAALARLRAETRAHNLDIEAQEAALAVGEPATVERHARLVLEASPYPKGFAPAPTTSFEAGAAKLVVNLTAPSRDAIVPKATAYRFVPQRDDVFAIRRDEAGSARLYEGILAQMALRALHEVFSTDPHRRIEKARVVLSTDTIDPATGKPARAQVLSVRATRKAFEALDLARVDPAACVRRLRGLDAPAPGA